MQLTNKRAAYARGVGLIELMITLVIGMIIVAAALSINISTLGANSWHIKASKLNMELSRIMTLVGNDLRRAGFADVIQVTSVNGSVVYDSSNTAEISSLYRLNAADAAMTLFKYSLDDGQLSVTVGAGSANNLNDIKLVRISSFSVTELARSATCSEDEGLQASPRVFLIEMTGALADDPNTSRSTSQSIKVRNDTVQSVVSC